MQTFQLPDALVGDDDGHDLARFDYDHPSLQGAAATQAEAHASELRGLRQRVAELEAELAAAQAAAQVRAEAAASLRATPEVSDSLFVESTAPAVAAVRPHPVAETAPQTASQPVAEPSAVGLATDTATESTEDQWVSDPGFAEAWSAEGEVVSFEERIAERAFFQAATVDEESRTWLIGS
jgi:hypothetical protein